MRLWHEKLLPYLSKQWLLGQHRECCALRGKGWKKKHSTVDYVFDYSPTYLYRYHRRVISELLNRGVVINNWWMIRTYRGKELGNDPSFLCLGVNAHSYPEHSEEYFKECVENLLLKQSQGKRPFREGAFEDYISTLI